ncbi:hypothetical protein SDC9_126549 [bioreactor metagenome]|uniref:Uncharacterized protein n=1 Tax=bioreactor metagenome TaxID=1076179 RepID=A0A645CRG3_9ZZZZ
MFKQRAVLPAVKISQPVFGDLKNPCALGREAPKPRQAFVYRKKNFLRQILCHHFACPGAQIDKLVDFVNISTIYRYELFVPPCFFCTHALPSLNRKLLCKQHGVVIKHFYL